MCSPKSHCSWPLGQGLLTASSCPAFPLLTHALGLLYCGSGGAKLAVYAHDVQMCEIISYKTTH
ncbi:hypothetical protein BD310DRAFT_249695 [Dichomitus squalens]|uniref:Uncharacterized protein n=1 Tax=Dichomitus squalens TaxID=114155 RepID=A0A4Q9PGA4_9APHY|nr:hypothetical protein BD310DRAFT_249695 [Dichomitus squalens]